MKSTTRRPASIPPEPGPYWLYGLRAVRAALVMCTNPAQSLPNAKQYREAIPGYFGADSPITATLPRLTPKPEVPGVISARIESAGQDGKYPYLDDKGRYHVRMHLDPDNAYGKGRWTPGYTINLGIGQGDMVTTPMQLARYMAAVANEGTLYPPHLVRKLVHPETGETIYPDMPEPETIPIKQEYFDVVKRGMKRVMESGTGYWIQIPDIPSGGKTGTAQNPHGEDHSVFIMFAPYEDPQIALGVIVENAGYGGVAAGPIASLMAEQFVRGELSDTPETKRRMRMALTAKSEPTRAMLAAQHDE